MHGGGAFADADGEELGDAGVAGAGEDFGEIFVVVEVAVGVNQHMFRVSSGEGVFRSVGGGVQEGNEAAWPTASKVYRYADMRVRRNPNGSESRDVGSGALVTGERVAIHESVQPAGLAPNPAHRIEHTEFICMREGELEFMHDGRTERAAAGDVKGTMHQARNVGHGPASYFVVAIGGDVR